MENLLGTAPFGITWNQYIIAASIILASLIVFWLIRPVLHRIATRRAGHHHKASVESIVDALVPPLRVLPVIVGGYIALHVLQLTGKASDVAGQVLKSAVIASVFWAIARLLANSDLLWEKLNPRLEESVRRWLGYGARVLVLLFGAAIILEIWNIPIAPLIGSLGVFGIAVGLAAKDLFSNLISGVLIMTERRFVPGEWIKVDGVVEGTVEEINFRSTKISRFDLSPVYVPNSALSDNATTNFSRMKHRRIYWVVGLEYSTSPDQLQEVRSGVEQWLLADARICDPAEAPLFVRVDSFGENSINLMIYCFTKTTVWSEWLEIKEDFALAMIPIVTGAGSGFAFPSRSVFLHQADPPEILTPQSQPE